jgi:hypothetical protein
MIIKFSAIVYAFWVLGAPRMDGCEDLRVTVSVWGFSTKKSRRKKKLMQKLNYK